MGKVLSNLIGHLWSKTFGLRLEGVGWKSAKGAAGAGIVALVCPYDCPGVKYKGNKFRVGVRLAIKKTTEEILDILCEHGKGLAEIT